MAVRIPPEARRLLEEPNFAHLATLMADGSPQSTPVWVDLDGDVVVCNTVRGRTKTGNLERDPRVALSVHDPAAPYSYVQVRGRAELIDEGAVDMIHRLSRKYRGRDFSDSLRPGDQRVTVRVTPESVFFAPPRG
jgi:PPOX class probable F420-dependent enzyme